MDFDINIIFLNIIAHSSIYSFIQLVNQSVDEIVSRLVEILTQHVEILSRLIEILTRQF